jgi:drug/metabolite transporter (DMT)-like permease
VRSGAVAARCVGARVLLCCGALGPPSRGVVGVLVAVLCLIWSSTWWAIRVGLEDLPPLTAAAARFLLAGVLMIAVARLLRGREAGATPPLWLAGTMAACNFAISYGILYYTETTVPSGIAAVLWAVFPVLMALSGHWFLGERLTPRRAAGFLVAFGGVVTMYLGDLGGDRAAVLPHACLLLASPLAAAVGTTVVKRHGSAYSSLLLNRDAMLLGGAALAVAALLLEHDAPRAFTARAVGSITFLAVIGTSVTFGIYFWLLRSSQASRLSLVSYVTPCLALLLGWAVGDGTLDLPTLGGTALIASGIALVVARGGRAAMVRR